MFCIDEYFHNLQAGNCHFRNITLTILTESNGSATVLKFGDLGELRTFLCSLANELKC